MKRLIDADELLDRMYSYDHVVDDEITDLVKNAKTIDYDPGDDKISKKTIRKAMGIVYDSILKYDGENSYRKFDVSEQNAVARAFVMLEAELGFPSDFGAEDPDEKN